MSAVLPGVLDYDPSRTDLTKAIVDRYFAGKIEQLSRDLTPLVQVASDYLFHYPTQQVVDLHRKHAPVFPYSYNFRGGFSFYHYIKAYKETGSHRFHLLLATPEAVVDKTGRFSETQLKANNSLGAKWSK